MSALALLGMWLVLLLGCKKEAGPSYTQFNGTDDSLTIEVGVEDLLDPVQIELTSSTGEVVVGTTTVDPGGGPAGTEHAIVVIIDDLYEHIVDRVSVRLDSGDRGEDEFELQQDSADEGVWKLTLVSVADEGELRQDTLTVRCWDEEEDDDKAADTASDGEGR